MCLFVQRYRPNGAQAGAPADTHPDPVPPPARSNPAPVSFTLEQAHDFALSYEQAQEDGEAVAGGDDDNSDLTHWEGRKKRGGCC